MQEKGSNKFINRRKFIKKGAATSLGLLLGHKIVFASSMPAGYIPIEWLKDTNIPGKDARMKVLNERPINAETPAHLLDDALTPADLFFVRNNGIPPELASINIDTWTLSIAGEAIKENKQYTLAELKRRFEIVTLQLTLECGGNGRSEFNPPAKGNQWTTGAVGCAEWTGVRLRDVLKDAGIKDNAVYIGYYGKDTHLSGASDKRPISRGVPLKKAMEAESLIAWNMNGEPLPLLNGYPLRLVFGGWPASCSGKWLDKIVVRDKVHDGTKMKGQSYRVPCKPVAPGTKVADEDMCIIESMPVKSLITYPKTGAMMQLGEKLPIRGHAWAGDLAVRSVHYSIDFGATWQACELSPPANRLAWQQWKSTIDFPQKGYYEVWVKATDDQGNSQPMLVPGWNPKGYLNNACHRIAIKII
jgi:DMSO/TMAO reductase YedYZ molybdopterin-dependent catalytic subunit